MTRSTNGRAGLGGRKRKRRKGGTVIHVTFGGGPPDGGGPPGGGPSGGGSTRVENAGTKPNTAPPQDGREPVTDLFNRREVAKLLGVSEARLRSLDRAKIVTPSGQRGKQRAYTFQDLIALRATCELLEHKVRLRDVARAIGALRTTLPRVTRPLQELRIVGDGRRVFVRSSTGRFES